MPAAPQSTIHSLDTNALADFAVTPSRCFIADQGGLMRIYNRADWSYETMNTSLDAPQLMTVGSHCVAVGRWSQEIQLWDDNGQKIQSWRLPRGAVKAIASDGTTGVIAFSPQDLKVNPGMKDNVTLLPSRLYRIDARGVLDSAQQISLGGIVSHIEIAGTHLAYGLFGEQQKLYLEDLQLGTKQMIALKGDLQSIACGAASQLYYATSQGIYALKGPVGKAVPELLHARQDDEASILRMVADADAIRWTSTSEGIMDLRSEQFITQTQAVEICNVDSTLWSLEAALGLQKWEQSWSWIVPFGSH